MKLRHLLPCALLVTAAVPRQAAAQQDVHLRNDCRLAGQILRTGHPAPHREWAWSVIPTCADSAGPVLAAVWNQRTQPHLAQLWGASHRVADARLSRAVMDALRDASRSRAERITAARVLATHAAPNLVVLESDLATIIGDSTRAAYISVDHSPVEQVAVPVTPEIVREIRETLDLVARQDGDRELQQVARAIARQIAIRVRS